MRPCAASWLIERDESKPWPSGSWQECTTPPTVGRTLRFNDELVLILRFCDSHAALFDEIAGLGVIEELMP